VSQKQNQIELSQRESLSRLTQNSHHPRQHRIQHHIQNRLTQRDFIIHSSMEMETEREREI
jgi:hypothetical protein